MRRGPYAGLAYGGVGECDAGFDLYAALGGTADGKWPAGGHRRRDAPERSPTNLAAADLGLRLPALLRFGRLAPARASPGFPSLTGVSLHAYARSAGACTDARPDPPA